MTHDNSSLDDLAVRVKTLDEVVLTLNDALPSHDTKPLIEKIDVLKAAVVLLTPPQ
jgi:hypothetical protein